MVSAVASAFFPKDTSKESKRPKKSQRSMVRVVSKRALDTKIADKYLQAVAVPPPIEVESRKKIAKRVLGSFSLYGDLHEWVVEPTVVSAYQIKVGIFDSTVLSLTELEIAMEEEILELLANRRIARAMLAWRSTASSRRRRRLMNGNFVLPNHEITQYFDLDCDDDDNKNEAYDAFDESPASPVLSGLQKSKKPRVSRASRQSVVRTSHTMVETDNELWHIVTPVLEPRKKHKLNLSRKSMVVTSSTSAPKLQPAPHARVIAAYLISKGAFENDGRGHAEDNASKPNTTQRPRRKSLPTLSSSREENKALTAAVVSKKPRRWSERGIFILKSLFRRPLKEKV